MHLRISDNRYVEQLPIPVFVGTKSANKKLARFIYNENFHRNATPFLRNPGKISSSFVMRDDEGFVVVVQEKVKKMGTLIDDCGK